MNEEIIQRLENLEQRINLLQASCESLSAMMATLLVQQSVVEVARSKLSPEEFGQNINTICLN